MSRWPTFEERFLKNIIKTDTCWMWIGKSRVRNGSCEYGIITLDGASMVAHRASWTFYRGPIPKGQLVCHECDNGLCVNPSHLFLGTQRDNMRDAAEKGRTAPNRKLTVEQAKAIMESNATYSEIAEQYGIHVKTVQRLQLRGWRGVDVSGILPEPRKRRFSRGERNGHSLLTEEIVKQIKRADGGYGTIAKRFGVSKSNVAKIRTSQAWKHIT